LVCSFAASAVMLGACSSHQKDNHAAASSDNAPASKAVPVHIADLPPAVRSSLDRESAGGQVMEIEKELKNGKTIYSADVMLKGQTWEISFDESGKMIQKKMEGKNEYEKDKAVK
jgi:hypothetical protein